MPIHHATTNAALGGDRLGDRRAFCGGRTADRRAAGRRAARCTERPTPAGVVSEFRGKVVAVRDGDTIVVQRHRRKVRVRIFGVDCPEHDQAFGAQATAFTRDHVAGREVRVEVHDHDIYGRSVAEVVLPDGENLGTELIRAGLAWHYRHYSSSAELDALEAQARAAKRGLWADPHPIPPWDFRHHAH
jgi:endonuclease YncB( thermonuclease family)